MVVAPDCGESHLGVGGAHGDAERRGRSLPVRGRVRVAHHQALSLQDDRLRVVLGSRHVREKNPAERQQERIHHGCVERRDRLLPRAEVSQSRHWSPAPRTRLTPMPLMDRDTSHVRVWQQKWKNLHKIQTQTSDACRRAPHLPLLSTADQNARPWVRGLRGICSELKADWDDGAQRCASDHSCSPQSCAACVRARAATLRTHTCATSSNRLPLVKFKTSWIFTLVQ